MIGELLAMLDEVEAEIDREIGSREVHDTHDYSSASYIGYDDGFNGGVQEATEMFRERLEGRLRALIIERRGQSS